MLHKNTPVSLATTTRGVAWVFLPAAPYTDTVSVTADACKPPQSVQQTVQLLFAMRPILLNLDIIAPLTRSVFGSAGSIEFTRLARNVSCSSSPPAGAAAPLDSFAVGGSGGRTDKSSRERGGSLSPTGTSAHTPGPETSDAEGSELLSLSRAATPPPPPSGFCACVGASTTSVKDREAAAAAGPAPCPG